MSFYGDEMDTGMSHNKSSVDLDPRYIRPSIKDEKLKSNPNLGGMYTFKCRILPFYVFEDGKMKMQVVDTVDKNGNPTKKELGVQYHYAIKQIRHKFRENKKFHNLACTKSIGKWECPICEANISDNKIGKKEGIPELIERGKRRSNSESWIIKVLIEEDYVNPENNGRVMLWEVTGVIYSMIQSAFGLDKEGKELVNASQQSLNPALAGISNQQQERFNPTHVASGVSLVVVCGPDLEKNNGMTTYKQSYWERRQDGSLNKKPLVVDANGNIDEEAITQLLAETYLLSDYTEFANIPSDEELRAELVKLNAAFNASSSDEGNKPPSVYTNNQNQSMAFNESTGYSNDQVNGQLPPMGNQVPPVQAPMGNQVPPVQAQVPPMNDPGVPPVNNNNNESLPF
jgi:hypothetical protein